MPGHKSRTPTAATTVLAGGLLLLQFAAGSAALAQSTFTHGWDCVVCETNSMLAGNFGHQTSQIFNMSDPWWIEEIAKSYAAVALNDFLGSQHYNETGESGRVTVARALKTANPKIRILYYFNPAMASTDPFVVDQILSHPEWWLKDDNGNVMWFRPPSAGSKGHPEIDLSVPAVQQWYANVPLTYFRDKTEAEHLFDGMFSDGAVYRDPSRNISESRYQKMYEGKMTALHLAQLSVSNLNGGDVWGNAALNNHPAGDSPPNVTWNTTLQNFNCAFEEMFGSFSTQNRDGSWNITLMERSIINIINASTAGHCVIIHAYPGPSYVPFQSRGPPGNSFFVTTWEGPVPVPNTTDGCREAAAQRVVESLAPFLIAANERVFMGYGWFYTLQDGYIPCKAGVECGMPSSWYPEFTHALGPPKGPAEREGTVWTREFQHASVYIDLKDRQASKITWS